MKKFVALVSLLAAGSAAIMAWPLSSTGDVTFTGAVIVGFWLSFTITV